ELTTALGARARKAARSRSYAFRSTWWTQGLSTVAHSSWAARSSSAGTARASSAAASSAVGSGAPKQSELKTTPVAESWKPAVAGVDDDRLGGAQDGCGDRQVTEPRDREGVGQDGDAGNGAQGMHGATPERGCRSERDLLGQQAGAGAATGEDATELDRVELQ